MHQRGFASVLIFVLVVLVLGGSFYYQTQHNKLNKNGLNSSQVQQEVKKTDSNSQYFIGDTSEFSEPPPSKEWNQYKGNGIIINYPSTLHAEASYPQSSTFLYYYKNKEDNNRIVTNLSFNLLKTETKQTTLQGYKQELLQQKQGIRLLNFSTVKIGNYNTLKYESGNLGGNYIHYVFLNKGNIYDISTAVESIKDKNFSQTFQQILESLSFTDDLSDSIAEIKDLLNKIDIDKKLNIPADQHGIPDVIKAEGEWAKIEARLVNKTTNVNIGGGPKIIVRKVNGNWEFAFEGESKYQEWKNLLPYSLKCITTYDDC